MFQEKDLVAEMPRLRKFAIRLAGDVSNADDLLQATVLRALEKKALFQPDTNLFRWSSKIMFNLFATEYRRKKKFETQYDPEIYMENLSMEASQETKADIMRLHEAMRSLPQLHRDILIMVCVRNMKYQEISEALQIPVGTVRSRLSRAREQLQNIFDPANQNRLTHQVPGYLMNGSSGYQGRTAAA